MPRNRPSPLVVLASATLAVAASTSGCSGPSPAGAIRPAPSATGARTPAEIVLQPGEAPAGTTYLKQGSGPQTLEQVVARDPKAGAEQAKLELAGFTGAYLTVFRGITFPSYLLRAHVVASYAAVFSSPDGASRAVSLLAKSATSSDQSESPVPAPGLGPHAIGYTVTLSSFPSRGWVYVWQQQSTVRVLADVGGTGVVTQEAALALAHEQALSSVSGGDGSSLVISPAQAPAGTALAAGRSGARTAAQFAPKPADAAALRSLGLQHGYVAQYLSPGLIKGPPSASAAQAATQGDYVASQAQQFRTPGQAVTAFRLFRTREDKLFGGTATALDTSGLGPESVGYKYVDKRPAGDLTGYAYFWQHDNFVLSLFDVGTDDRVSAATAARLAAVMQAHAGS